MDNNIIPMNIPPVSLVPTPDLSNLDALQPANPDLLAQTDLTNLDVQQSIDANMPDMQAHPNLSNLAQEELPPPPFSPAAQPTESLNVPSVLPQDMGQNMPSGLLQGAGQNMPPTSPQGMMQKVPLFMSGAVMVDSSGGNIERISRAWSLLKTPVFATVQDNSVMSSTRITNKIGQATNRNGMNVAVSRLRLI